MKKADSLCAAYQPINFNLLVFEYECDDFVAQVHEHASGTYRVRCT